MVLLTGKLTEQDGPSGVRAALASICGSEPASFELVGQGIDHDLGSAATRFLDAEGRGIVVSARASGTNALAQVVILDGGEAVGSRAVLELQDRDFGIARVTLADADLIFAYYVTSMGENRDSALQSAHSKEYFEASKGLWASEQLKVVADVPEIEPSSEAHSRATPSAWLPRRSLGY